MTGPGGPPRRKSIRLPRAAYADANSIFSVTICCENKRPHLDGEIVAEAILRTMQGGSLNGYADLVAYCLMPDHVHLLVRVSASDLVDAISRWKSYTTRLFWREGGDGRLWQRSFYDHGVRKEEDLVQAVSYILQNPERAGRPDRARYAWSRFPYP